MLKKLDDEAFDEYIKEQLEKFKKKKDKQANNELLRMNSFIYQILTDLRRDKNRKQKFNFLSPLQFSDYPLIKELNQEQENDDNEDDMNNIYNKINDNDNNILITTTFQKKLYDNINENNET